MLFVYTATKNGQTYSDTIDVEDRFAVYRHVRSEGAQVVSVSRAESPWSFSYWNERFSTIKAQEIIVFAGNLSAMLSAGLPISRGIAISERQSKNPRLKRILRDINGFIQKGGTFYKALEQHPSVFSKLFVAMVRAGEESGNLHGALKTVRDQMKSSDDLKKKIRGALIYPSIIVFAIGIVGFLLMTKVVPTLASTFKELNAELPAATQAIITASNFMTEHTIIVLVALVTIVSVLYAWLSTPSGKRLFDRSLLTLPVIGTLVCEINAARAARTTGSLLSSGVDMVSALSITSEVVQNSFHRDVLTEGIAAVKRGELLSGVFQKNERLYPALVGEMVAVGEETGALSDMLVRVAEFYEAEVSEKTKNMTTIIEPFLMLFVGGAVGFFAYAMVGPIYSLSDAF